MQRFPGINISGLGYEIANRKCDIWSYNVIIIHVGTNDIHSRTIYQLYCFYKSLLYQIRYHNFSAKILMSAIIPRWCDFAISQQKVVLVNNMVKN